MPNAVVSVFSVVKYPANVYPVFETVGRVPIAFAYSTVVEIETKSSEIVQPANSPKLPPLPSIVIVYSFATQFALNVAPSSLVQLPFVI